MTVSVLIFVLAAVGLLVSRSTGDSTAAWVMLGLLVAAIVAAKWPTRSKR